MHAAFTQRLDATLTTFETILSQLDVTYMCAVLVVYAVTTQRTQSVDLQPTLATCPPADSETALRWWS